MKPMKVIAPREKERHRLGDLSNRCAFQCDGRLYLKIKQDSYQWIDVWEIGDGVNDLPTQMDRETRVIPLVATLSLGYL